jgi:hypothetical protein
MFRIDLGLDDPGLKDLVQSLCDAVEEWGLLAVFRAIAEPWEHETRSHHRIDGHVRCELHELVERLGLRSMCNILPAELEGGVCQRLLVAFSQGSKGKQGSIALLDQTIRHLAVCGLSVDGDRPTREPTRFVLFFHNELNTKAFTERHRPTLKAFRSRGVRIVMLHVDSANRITWVERDLADAVRVPSH